MSIGMLKKEFLQPVELILCNLNIVMGECIEIYRIIWCLWLFTSAMVAYNVFWVQLQGQSLWIILKLL